MTLTERAPNPRSRHHPLRIAHRGGFVAGEVPLKAGEAPLTTDIEGSTRLWEEDPDAMGLALRDHYPVNPSPTR
jgi:class 3 adenylate cyclase